MAEIVTARDIYENYGEGDDEGYENVRYVRESDYAVLRDRHRRLVYRAECALPWVESVTEYHELLAALAEEVDDGKR
jgi:hypothetical protein